MSITDELRKSFDQCTYKAGVAPDEFDTVWITKSCALSMLDDIDDAFEAGHSRAVEYGKRMGRGTCGEWRNECTYYDPTGVEAELWCEHCDEPLEVDWQFCPHCGRKVVVDA